MNVLELNVAGRQSRGKGAARKLRATGMAPGNVYGQHVEPMKVSFRPSDLKLLAKSPWGQNQVLKLQIDGGEACLVMVKEIQSHPVSRQILHTDFYRLHEDSKVTVKIPLVPTGRAEGVKSGGLLKQLVRKITVSCSPMAIPVELKMDVTALAVGDALHISDLEMPEGVEAIYKDNYATITVVA